MNRRLMVGIIVFMIIPTVLSASNTKMGFQGRVLNKTDNATIETGTLQVNISVNNDCDGELYSESFVDPFNNGIFDVMLGEGVDLPLNYDDEYYICAVVNEEQVTIDNFRSGVGEIYADKTNFSTNMSLWNDAYSWGDHGNEQYLTEAIGQTHFLNLSGTNANQNIHIEPYNFSTGYLESEGGLKVLNGTTSLQTCEDDDYCFNTGSASVIMGYATRIILVPTFEKRGGFSSTGMGSIAAGYATNVAGYDDETKWINSTGDGSFAGGITRNDPYNIIGSGDGSFTWGSGGLYNDHIAGFTVGQNNVLNGTGKVAGIAIGASNVVSESYVVAMGFGNQIQTGGTNPAFAIGASNIISGAKSGAIGQFNLATHSQNYIFGLDLDSERDNEVTVGYTNDSKIQINSTRINLKGDTYFENTSLVNNPHIEVYNITPNGYTLSIANIDEWTNFTGLDFGENNSFTVNENGFSPDYDGRYKMDYSVSFGGGASSLYSISALINGVEHSPCRIYRLLGAGGDVGNAGGSCILTLNAGDNITGAVQDNQAPAQDMVVWSVNANLVRIGNI